MKALSIRQPWAWLIVRGHKDIENRDWYTGYRGEILVHTGKGMTKAEYQDAQDLCLCMKQPLVTLPPFEELERGGIVGSVFIANCVSESDSPWFFGKFGFVLKGAKTLPFRP